MRRIAPPLSALVVATALLTGCAGSIDSTSGGSSVASSARGPVTGTVTVFAAASLQEAFTALGARFEAAHAGTRVAFNFGPSSGLAEQIKQEAPADVFASASTTTMEQIVSSGAAAAARPFATNTMQIAVPPDNPAHIRAVGDLANPGVKLALCQAAVPCGATARKVLDNAKLQVTPVTEELDVKATLSKVSLGEVDAGIVYVTDVRAAGTSVQGIDIPGQVNATTTYPIATLTRSKNPEAAQAFVDYVLSAQGREALTAAGFSSP